eukprot:TRINITY_DN7892_c0_g1_i1.p1 TRINITY_DN7892_c0_g1~~TRINITY_DN7892_c0_g1_i1.p1  ORF type:complete len:395 (-),score=68.18 TRINITY_DN7892_c0_g1_i1:57-1241(-)
MAESTEKVELRRLIRLTQLDTKLSPIQKAKRTQMLMSGKSLDEIVAIEKEDADKEAKSAKLNAQFDPPSDQDFVPSYWVKQSSEGENVLGCKHYPIDCKVRAPCCGKFFVCRLCHDEKSDHKINRHAVTEMICMHCKTLQPISQTCKQCEKSLARYYCPICKFHDDTPDKKIYHCPHCGICRVGEGLGKDFFHCDTCGLCLSIQLRDHKCIENRGKADCTICGEDLFTSTIGISVLDCGHVLHKNCLNNYYKSGSYRCPLCSKSTLDMSSYWTDLQSNIDAQPMPEEFSQAKCQILCNDCQAKSEVPYHFIGVSCPKEDCKSFNTQVINRTGEWPTTEQWIRLNEERARRLMESREVNNEEGEEENDDDEEDLSDLSDEEEEDSMEAENQTSNS